MPRCVPGFDPARKLRQLGREVLVFDGTRERHHVGMGTDHVRDVEQADPISDVMLSGTDRVSVIGTLHATKWVDLAVRIAFDDLRTAPPDPRWSTFGKARRNWRELFRCRQVRQSRRAVSAASGRPTAAGRVRARRPGAVRGCRGIGQGERRPRRGSRRCYLVQHANHAETKVLKPSTACQRRQRQPPHGVFLTALRPLPRAGSPSAGPAWHTARATGGIRLGVRSADRRSPAGRARTWQYPTTRTTGRP
ncbi:hypothetical protein EHYA_09556 [Embleya hyalina]|uniref:Uncharacterized protein n=1 Tax=Embleya hyalina TaxID=516124 RepID=A0A401Z4J4_9ACTN|nr:hypothetical protein EHYA_09556 [Embleya hyalina]